MDLFSELGKHIPTAIMLYNFAKPFLVKTGESIAKKIGEDIWNHIKSSFSSKEEKELVEKVEKIVTLSKEEQASLEANFIQILADKIRTDPEFNKNSDLRIQQAQKIINIETIHGGATFNL
ncbi:MAG: hypothetical protein MUF71_09020 [Candidatus Kapabacteria bacterium]|jgi:hypothetical protein|nr:hypothetical protein [Candidatus Kapabacteria bacterium]